MRARIESTLCVIILWRIFMQIYIVDHRCQRGRCRRDSCNDVCYKSPCQVQTVDNSCLTPPTTLFHHWFWHDVLENLYHPILYTRIAHCSDMYVKEFMRILPVRKSIRFASSELFPRIIVKRWFISYLWYDKLFETCFFICAI